MKIHIDIFILKPWTAQKKAVEKELKTLFFSMFIMNVELGNFSDNLFLACSVFKLSIQILYLLLLLKVLHQFYFEGKFFRMYF